MPTSEKIWSKSSMDEINKGDCRIVLNGKRHYTTPLPTGPAPSVTTILSETASEQSKKKLLLNVERLSISAAKTM